MNPLHFDDLNRRLEISVRELIEDDDVFRRVGFDRSQSWRRLALGGEAHRRALASRQEAFRHYLGEVFLTAEFDFGAFRAVVAGRADGAVEARSGHWLVEEFKTCSFSPDGRAQFSPEREERARRQVVVYCLLWELSGRGCARGQIVLIDGAGHREEVREVDFDAVGAERSVRRWITAKFERIQAAARQREECAAASEGILFPFSAVRAVQTPLIEAIGAAIRGEGHLLAQAPTGSGKTAAALFAGLRGALSRSKKLLYLTSKTLQQNLVVETLATINDGTFRVLRMRAKEKMCANDRILCHEEHCRFARDYPAKMERSGLLGRLLNSQPMLEPDLVFEHAHGLEVCPFEVEIELASRVDVFVGDYNYVFEPVTALRAFAPEFLKDAVLVIDEAHNLPDRVRQIYSPELSESDIAQVENLASLSPGDVWRRLGSALSRLRRYVSECAADLPESGETIAEARLPEDEYEEFLGAWDAAMLSYFEWKREVGDFSQDDPVLGLHFALVRFGLVMRLARGRQDFARTAARTPSGLKLAFVCLDPSRILGPILNAASSSILLSATLEPFAALARLTGLDPDRMATLALPPPFPRENRRIMIVPSVRTTFASREKNYDRIAQLLAGMADAHPGNDLALFPSYRFLREVAARLPPTRARILEQRENLTDFEKRAILDALGNPPADGILFLAVSGGMYAEGVDYAGDRLSGVFVVSPSLPQVCFERELLRRYFDEQGEAGFEYAYILPGLTRVIQAAGRLIRSESDRGVIALICRRFLEEPYVRYLPRDWYDEEPSDLVAADPPGAIREFFAGS